MFYFKSIFCVIFVFCLVTSVSAQQEKTKVIAQLDKEYPHYAALAQRIWKLAEPGYLENETSSLLQKELQSQGFTITTGVADMPTALWPALGKGLL